MRFWRLVEFATALILLAPQPAAALPIGFGVNQAPNDYAERRSDHFIVYHDARVPSEGALTLNALEAARPYLELWMGQKRLGPLPVVTSAVTDGASFANFITDALEIQTMGQGTRDLAWHEYTHSTMYRAFDNVFGPAGSILNLPWMPAWFLEGLAEAMSVSVGSDVTAGIERYQALAGDWPSFDRLHSLYSNINFFERGYATSGAIVSYLLRTGDASRLPEMLADFRRYSMPWWWPWAAVPYNGFMPMDKTLEHYIGKNEQAVYEAYKKAARAFWLHAAKGPFLAGEKPRARKAFTSIAGLHSDGKRLLQAARIDGDIWDVALTFDAETGWATDWRPRTKLPSDFGSVAGFSNSAWQGRVHYDADRSNTLSTIDFRPQGKNAKAKGKARQLRRPGFVYGLWEGEKRFLWLEQQQATIRLCSTPKAGGKVSCIQTATVPHKIHSLGARPRRPGDGVAGSVWLAETEEKLTGTVNQVSIWDPNKNARVGGFTVTATPLKVAFAGDDTWLLMAERNRRTLRRYDQAGRCLSMLTFQDHILDALGLADGSLVLGLYAGSDTYVIRLPKDRLRPTPCTPEDIPTSPVQWAVTKGGQVDLKTAVAGASLWVSTPMPPTPAEAKATAERPPADQDIQPGTGTSSTSEPSKWHGRPLFLFPWIGADDALGLQVGMVSIPLMDNMQNETVRATFLLGVASRFPYQELALTSTRFIPTLNLALFRQQVYNGALVVGKQSELSYLQEKGIRLDSSTQTRALGGSLVFGLGVKYSNLKPYMGPYAEFVRQGNLVETASSLTLTHLVGPLTFVNSISGRIAPGSLNEDFDYNQVGFATSVTEALPFLASHLTLGLEGSRTRGKKRRELQEYYVPLKTFIPGSGGGYNQNSYPLQGESSLFAVVQGDTEGRAKVNWTFPVISDLDKWFWLVYMERLDFTAFYNYGAAWNGPHPRNWRRLIRAHGYNIDLQMENKGVRFNVGLGIGQVVGQPFETYATAGFDALF